MGNRPDISVLVRSAESCDVAVLVRGYSLWFWMLLLVPLGFMVIGGGGLAYTLWHWGKSPEHQAARGQLGRIDLFEEINARATIFRWCPTMQI